MHEKKKTFQFSALFTMNFSYVKISEKKIQILKSYGTNFHPHVHVIKIQLELRGK